MRGFSFFVVVAIGACTGVDAVTQPSQNATGSDAGTDTGDGSSNEQRSDAGDATLALTPLATVSIGKGLVGTVKVTLERGKDLRDAVTVQGRDFKYGIVATPIVVKGDTGELAISVPADAPEGPTSGIVEAMVNNTVVTASLTVVVTSSVVTDAGADAGFDAGVDAGPLDVRDWCVAEINAYRATVGAAALSRWKSTEACVDGQAKSDYMAGHGASAFTACGEVGQNPCIDWPAADVQGSLRTCMQAMWAQGPGADFATHGYYINMANSSYTKVACGIHVTAAGKLWAELDFQ